MYWFVSNISLHASCHTSHVRSICTHFVVASVHYPEKASPSLPCSVDCKGYFLCSLHSMTSRMSPLLYCSSSHGQVINVSDPKWKEMATDLRVETSLKISSFPFFVGFQIIGKWDISRDLVVYSSTIMVP